MACLGFHMITLAETVIYRAAIQQVVMIFFNALKNASSVFACVRLCK